MPGGKYCPCLRHERVEVVGRIGTGGVLLEERVQVADHVAHARQVLRRDPLDALLQPLEVRLQHLAAQLVGQGVEGVARLVVHELVVAQAVEAAGHVRRQRVEPVLALARRAPHDLLRHPGLVLLVAGRGVEGPLLGLVDAPLDAGALRVQDPLQPFVDVVEDAVEVRLARAPPAGAPAAARGSAAGPGCRRRASRAGRAASAAGGPGARRPRRGCPPRARRARHPRRRRAAAGCRPISSSGRCSSCGSA